MRRIIQKRFNMTENFSERVKMCTESRLTNTTKSAALLYLLPQSTNVIPKKYVGEALWLWQLHHISKQIFASTCGNSGKFFLESNLRTLSISLLVFSTFKKCPKLFWSFPIGCFWTSGHSLLSCVHFSLLSLKYSTQNWIPCCS